MKRKIVQRTINTQRLKLDHLSEEELTRRLYITVVSIICIIIFLTGSLVLFAPKIGGLFAFVSRHYNEQEPETEIIPGAPAFISVPEATKEERITLEGVSEPGMTIKLYVNGPETQSTIADTEGKFTFADVQLIKGKNIIYARSISPKNIESEKSENTNIEYDDKAPEITIEQPKHNSTVRNLDSRILIKGKVNEKSTVKVNDRQAILKPDLSFEIILGVEEGNVVIKFEAEDAAGNKKEEKITINYVKSS